MANEITHVRLSNNDADSTEEITKVKLRSEAEQFVSSVIRNIDSGEDYYYTTSINSKAYVEVVRPSGRDPYIRTKGNQTKKDNLLSLPRF